MDRDTDDAPGCLPGLRPERSRDERFFAGFFSHGASEDGGCEEFDESADSRRCSSVIRSAWAATTRLSSTSSTRTSSRDTPSGNPGTDTPRSSQRRLRPSERPLPGVQATAE